MDADNEIFEIAAVMRGFWLPGAEAYQHRHGSSFGESLTPGYYQMNWPDNIRIRSLELHAFFKGDSVSAASRKRDRIKMLSVQPGGSVDSRG